MRHASVSAARFCCADARSLGCGCATAAEPEPGLGFLDKIVKEIGRGVERIGKEIGRGYDRVEDAIKPYLPAIASAIPVIGQALGPVVGQYRQVRELEKLDEREKKYAQDELPKQLMQRACTGGMPLDCPGAAPPTLTDATLRDAAAALREFHREANYKALIVGAGASPGPVIEQILVKQDQDAAAWAQYVALAQQRAQVAVTGAGQGSAASSASVNQWLPYAAAGALLLVAVIRR